MERRSKFITFIIAASLSYGVFFALIGPEKVRAWHHQHSYFGHWHHHHHCDHAVPGDNQPNTNNKESL